MNFVTLLKAIFPLFEIILVIQANGLAERDLIGGYRGCLPFQYIELGRRQIIQCAFPTPFNALYWYDDALPVGESLVLSFVNSRIHGRGYETGEYDVLTNGSLVITNVTFYHERTFTVICLDSRDDRSVFNISLIVTVVPNFEGPTISGCKKPGICLVDGDKNMLLECTSSIAKPSVQLKWYMTSNGNVQEVSATFVTLPKDNAFYVVSTISLSQFSDLVLVSLVCTSFYEPMQLESKSTALVQILQDSVARVSPLDLQYFEINNRATLKCSRRVQNGNFVWKREKNGRYETIAYRKSHEGTFREESGFDVNVYGDLIIDKLSVTHEGNYTCLCGEMPIHSIRVTQVIVVVPPSATTLNVNECSAKEECILLFKGNGSLTCNVDAVRPVVSLEWSFNSVMENLFTEQKKQIVREISSLFDVSRTIKFVVNEVPKCNSKWQMKCEANDPVSQFLNIHSVDVILIYDSQNCTEAGETTKRPIIVGIIVTIVLILASVGMVKCYKGRRRDRLQNDTSGESEEKHVLIRGKQPHPKIDLFISRLVQTYADMNHDDTYMPNVMSVTCVTTGVEKIMKSYHDLLRTPELANQSVAVIEGEPGIGKTSLGLYLAKAWCANQMKKSDNSLTMDFEVLILLNVAKTRPHSTVYDVIKDQLLPADCDEIDKNDIKEILREQDKCILIVDGFDENTEKMPSFRNGFVAEIFENNWMQSSLKLVLTRSRRTVEKYTDLKFLVAKLEPFTLQQIEQYVGIVFDCQSYRGEQLKEKIRRYDVLHHFCKNPFLLSMVCELFHNDRSIASECTTMTKFIQQAFDVNLTSCLKVNKKKNVREGFTCSQNLACFALDCMFENKHFWPTLTLRDHGIHQDEINNLKLMKILVEASNNDIEDDREILYKFSNLISQYFVSAHCLALMEDESKLREALERIDITSCKHLLFYTCGLNENCLQGVLNFILNEHGSVPRDIIAYCIFESGIKKGEKIRQSLQLLSIEEHRFDVLDKDDRQLKLSTAMLLELCSEQKITIGVLRLFNVNIDMYNKPKIEVEGRSFSLPLLRVINVTEFRDNSTMQQLPSVIKVLPSIKELVVRSLMKPKDLEDDVLDILQHKKVVVIWMFYRTAPVEALENVRVYYPSPTFRKWMTFIDAFAVRIKRVSAYTCNISEQKLLQLSLSKSWWPGALKEVGVPKDGIDTFVEKTEKIMEERKSILHLWNQADDLEHREDIPELTKILNKNMKSLRSIMKIDAEWITRKPGVADVFDSLADVEENGLAPPGYETGRTKEKETFMNILHQFYWKAQV